MSSSESQFPIAIPAPARASSADPERDPAGGHDLAERNHRLAAMNSELAEPGQPECSKHCTRDS
jgi:hypothetical protein